MVRVDGKPWWKTYYQMTQVPQSSYGRNTRFIVISCSIWHLKEIINCQNQLFKTISGYIKYSNDG